MILILCLSKKAKGSKGVKKKTRFFVSQIHVHRAGSWLLLFICVVLDQNGVGDVSIVLLKLHHVFVEGTDKAHAVSIL